MLTFDDLASWAGAEHVTRADPATVAGWHIPEDQKLTLVNIGVPVVGQLIEHADFQTSPRPALQTSSGAPLYRLTRNHHRNIRPGLLWAFGAEPHTGKVSYVLPHGEAWFANSAISLWLRTLHHYGLRVSQSPILHDPDQNEDQALAELPQARRRAQGHPPAFAGTTDSSGPSSSNAGYGDRQPAPSHKHEHPPQLTVSRHSDTSDIRPRHFVGRLHEHRAAQGTQPGPRPRG